ncbi:MAG: hypothetical protein OEU90_15615 [Gammaproteobacteria bacterium]|nr:hypothetical protein [Gammaproteobacteria bacterium]MDH3750497.1 hypothetical protein [Gammaproteobacteria bacterium]MDH3806880.1 hypothetical protein [Gammaproteobacteria bacterium]
MNSHKTKTGTVVITESVRIETDQKEPRVLRSKLVDANELSLADDFDIGGDPYNSTGQHVIVKPKTDIEE